MDKVAIIYASVHHGNTRKLVEAIADQHEVVLIDALKCHQADLSEFDLIGFASGIDFGNFYDPVEQFLVNHLPQGKRVFFLYTCAKVRRHFTDSIKAAAAKKEAIVAGEYGCKGWNTYGPLKFIGGMNQKHPSAQEIAGALDFFASLL